MKTTPTSWKRWLFGSLLAATVLGAGYYGARYAAWPAIKVWRIERMNRDAAAFLAAGDPANALLVARKSLHSSTQNAGAWRIAATAAAAREHGEALWYQDNLCREEPTRENQLQLIRLALRFDVPGYALATLKAMAKDARTDPEFHRLAARVFVRTGQPLAAKFHLITLIQLEPADRTAQLDLAEIELAADPARSDPALRARVLALAAEPGLRRRVLTMLLRENVAARSLDGTGELVRRLQLEPEPDVAERLLVLDALFLLGAPEASPRLAQLQAEVADRPAAVARVLEFLTRTGRAAAVQPWVATLPAAMRGQEEVQHGSAEALLALHDAAGLEALLRGGSWPQADYLREALLAHAYRDQGRSADFAEAWKLALIGAGVDIRRTTALLARVDEWRWVNERHDVIWRLFALVPANETVQQSLVIWERHQGNTANLNRLFTRIVEVQPKDDTARNNLAYTSLLLDSNLARAGLIAAELVAAQPRNPYYATTYALALYKQGHVTEALARLDALTPGERSEPVRQLLRALCLATLGQAAPASETLNNVVLTDLLPEERHLAEVVVTQVAKLDRVQGNRSRLLTFHQGQEAGAGAAGWLALVGPATRAASTTDMQLADSLYAEPDWDGLRDLLRTTNWQAADYLRAALLAQVLRRQGDLRQSGEEWRQALALADRDPARLQNLRALATHWKWTPERLETLNLIFERNPNDRALLTELLVYYRETRRTPELMRVLGLYLADAPDTSDEAVAHAYYSLLLDSNVARAHVVARHAFEVAPADLSRRMVYVFSLWKQRRAAEAMPLLAAVKPEAVSPLVPVALLRATILLQLGGSEAARTSLARFDADAALPEEVMLADRMTGLLAAQAESIKPPRT